MPRGRRRFALVIVVLAVACTQFDVRVDRDPAFDLAQKPSWAWLPPELMAPADQRLPDRHLERKLATTVGSVLQTKGYRESDRPELFVNYRLTTDAHTDVDVRPGYGLGWWAYRESTDRYDVGTLFLDVVDARTRTLVWRGTASARLLSHASYEKRARRTEEVVRQLLETFPDHRQS